MFFYYVAPFLSMRNQPGSLTMANYQKRRVLVDDIEIYVTPMEYKLLLLMIANKG